MKENEQSEVNPAHEDTNMQGEKPRLKPVIEGAESLSLGISMVVAVLIGVDFRSGLRKFQVDATRFFGLAVEGLQTVSGDLEIPGK